MLKNLSTGLLLLTFSAQLSASYFPFDTEANNEIKQQASDHRMFATDVVDQSLTLATYNSWARGTRSGFIGQTELMDVETRIKTNIAKIKHLFQIRPNTILGFQEWNPNDLESLKSSLGSSYHLLSAPTGGESFCHGLICQKALYNVMGQSSTDLVSLNTLQAWKPKGNNGTQQNRYLHVKLQSITTKRILDIICVHLRWQSKRQELDLALQQVFGIGENVCTIGDFNQNLTSFSHANVKAFISVNGSQVYDTQTKQPRLETNDAILYQFSSKKPSQSQSSTSSVSSMTSNPELQTLLSSIHLEFRENIVEDYDAGQFDILSIRTLANIPSHAQESAYAELNQNYMLNGTNQQRLEQGIEIIKNRYSTLQQPPVFYGFSAPVVPQYTHQQPVSSQYPVFYGFSAPVVPQYTHQQPVSSQYAMFSGFSTPVVPQYPPQQPVSSQYTMFSGFSAPVVPQYPPQQLVSSQYAMFSGFSTPVIPQYTYQQPVLTHSGFLPTSTNNQWGRFASFEDCVTKGIVVSLQKKVKEHYNNGAILPTQILELTKVSFKDQSSNWLRIMKVPL